MEWNMEEDFSMEWNIEWKKIATMEYGKIVFHSIPFHTMPCKSPHWYVIKYHARKNFLTFSLNKSIVMYSRSSLYNYSNHG